MKNWISVFFITLVIAIPVFSQSEFSCGQTIVSCYSGDRTTNDPTSHVLGIVDARDRTGINPNPARNLASNFNMRAPANWSAENLGEIFGVTTDPNFNIYTTATTIYPIDYFGSDPANNGGEVHRIAPDESVSLLVRLPNSRQGLGNICYAKADDGTELLFVTNWENGFIYRINLTNYNGNPTDDSNWTSFDPFNLDDGVPGYAPLGQLTWGIGFNPIENKLYFGRWMQNSGDVGGANQCNTCGSAGNLDLGLGANEIHSVALDNTGNFASSSSSLEFTAPATHLSNGAGTTIMSNPISDIAFSSAGKMLISERSMCCPTEGGAHRANVWELMNTGGTWQINSATYHIGPSGNADNRDNSAGGIDYGYDNWDLNNLDTIPPCDSMIWATCDVIAHQTYGIVGLPPTGNNSNVLNSYYINVAERNDGIQKRMIGDVEVFKCDCPNNPPPPLSSMGCCDSLENQVINGDFEFGPEGFESDYERESDISVSSILPGSFGVINTEQANSICDNWNVDDHTTNCDGAGNFLVVNGRTGQAGSAIFWEQTLAVDTGSYKLCASFKHLEQCCFDVTPTIDIIINGDIVETVIVDQTDGDDSCSWQEYTYSFEVTDSPILIQFALDETALGDGNDLAIDDMIIVNLPKVPFDLALAGGTGPNDKFRASVNSGGPLPGDNTLPGDEDDQIPDGCEYEWFIGKIDGISLDPITGELIPTSYVSTSILMGGPGFSANWGLTTRFEGYDFNSNPPFNSGNFSGGIPGVFDVGSYAVTLTLKNCDCYAEATLGNVFSPNTSNRTIIGGNNEIKLTKESLEQIKVLKESFRAGTLTNTVSLEEGAELLLKKEKASLDQNEPNPFDNSTSISYSLPDNSLSAMLRITGIDGKVVETISLPLISNGQVRIDASRYWEGIYFYSLIVDDRVVETKRMVLTR